MPKIMLSLFDYSTVMAQPWANAGYICYCWDVQHPPGHTKEGNIIKVGGHEGNILSQQWHDNIPMYRSHHGEIALVTCFPPCTDVAVSGARWFKAKGLKGLIQALRLFDVAKDVCELSDAPYMIENPVSTISTYYRKPDHTFDPCDYGDPWTKKTCLWTGNGFIMPPKNRVEPTEKGKTHRMSPAPDRANKRSETPPGFAKAVFQANADITMEENNETTE